MLNGFCGRPRRGRVRWSEARQEAAPLRGQAGEAACFSEGQENLGGAGNGITSNGIGHQVRADDGSSSLIRPDTRIRLRCPTFRCPLEKGASTSEIVHVRRIPVEGHETAQKGLAARSYGLRWTGAAAPALLKRTAKDSRAPPYFA